MEEKQTINTVYLSSLLWCSDASPISIKRQTNSRQKPARNMHTFIKTETTTTLSNSAYSIREGKSHG